MSPTMEGFRCWNTSAVRETVYSDIGALPSDADAVFLAAHTPMVVSHPLGTELAEAGSGERQVLEAVRSNVGDSDRNSLIAVTGPSGTGKSHVIRWVHANLDKEDDRYHVLYVPRVVQTIRELLRRIILGLPGGEGGQQILDRIDAAIGSASPAEVSDRLLEEVRHCLNWTIDRHPAAEGETAEEKEVREERNDFLGDQDEYGKRRNGLSDLLALPPVNKALLAPGGCLDRVVQSFYEHTSQRDVQLDGFQVDDLPLREPGVRKAARQASSDGELSGLWSLITRDPTPALNLLNEALSQAVRKTLGLQTNDGRESLDSLFRSARADLRRDGKELILLFEDLAQFGLVDGELYDQFTVQPGEDLAPLRVAFAVTDDPFYKMPQTVRTRITHRFTVDSPPLADRATFVGRYLNLVRIGRSGIEDARAQATNAAAGDWVTNACDTRESGRPCRVRDECHSGFGTVEVAGVGVVGLYPYNMSALRRAVEPRETTRQIVDVCLSEFLTEADGHLQRNTFPHAKIWDQVDHRVQKPRDALLDGKSGVDAERLYRALVLWGDESHLHQSVLDAFSLTSLAAAAPTNGPQVDVVPGGSVRSGRVIDKRESPLPKLYEWQNGEPLPDDHANFYRNTLYRLVLSRLDLEQELLHIATGHGQEILSRVFNMTSFDLGEDSRGRPIGAGGVRIQLRRVNEDVEVMAAARWFSDHGHWLPDQGRWEWPPGYTPMGLMLTLENRLGQWAEEVRQAFKTRVQGRSIARAAVGTRSVALLASGVPLSLLRDLDDVFQAPPTMTAPPIASWDAAVSAAKNVLRGIAVPKYLEEFAAVRQGDSGEPQLVDAVGLADVLDEVAHSPSGFLRTVVNDLRDVEPVLAEAARGLADAVEAAAPSLLDTLDKAVNVLCDRLEGHPPDAAARALLEVGMRARDSGLLRPAGWAPFADQVDVLRALPSELALNWRRPDKDVGAVCADEALVVQHWSRTVVAGAEAIEQLHRSMEQTKAECLRRGRVAGDVAQLEVDVRQRLEHVESQLRALGAGEASRG